MFTIMLQESFEKVAGDSASASTRERLNTCNSVFFNGFRIRAISEFNRIVDKRLKTNNGQIFIIVIRVNQKVISLEDSDRE